MNNAAPPNQEKPGFLFVGPYPPPYGGIATHLLDLTEHLSNEGYRSQVLNFTRGQSGEERVQENLFVNRVPIRLNTRTLATLGRRIARIPSIVELFTSYPRPRKFASAFLKSLHIIGLMRRHGLRTVSVYGADEGIVVPFLRRLDPDIRILYTVFAAPYKWPDHFQRYERFYRLTVTEADRVLASSNYCAGAATQLAEDLDVDVIYYGVDLDRFHPPEERELGVGDPSLIDKVVIRFLGRMEPEMGVLHALTIARMVNEVRDDTVFVIAGAKGSATSTVKEAAERSDGRIRCTVDLPSEQLPSFYASADIVIAPTVDRWACMGMAIKEALATGRAVVAAGSGGIPEAIRDGVEGFVVPITPSGEVDEDGFAQAVLRLCGDSGLRNSMGQNGRERATSLFNVDVTHRRVLEALLARQL